MNIATFAFAAAAVAVTAVAAVAVTAVAAVAQDAPAPDAALVTDAAATAVAPDAVVSPASQGVPAFFSTLCEMSSAGRVTLSEAAVSACNGAGKMPRVTKDGARFFNTGAGAEFNALAANIERF